jgi:hypothetical protein
MQHAKTIPTASISTKRTRGGH